MHKSNLISIPLLLIGISASLGQEPESPTAPNSKKDTPAAPTRDADHDHSADHSAAWFSTDGLQIPFIPEAWMMRHGIFTVDPQYVLWFRGHTQDTIGVANNGVVLNQQGTTILGQVGNTELAQRDMASGGRLALGYWQVQKNQWIPGGIRDLGAEATFFFVAQRSGKFVDDTSFNIIRPFFDVNNRQTSAFVVASPGLATGSLEADAQASFWGAEANVWKTICYDYPGTYWSFNVMAGFRFLNLEERLNINSISVFNQNLAAFPTFLPFAGNTLQVSDSFATHNHFYGGQLGIGGKWWPLEGACLDFGLKLALGATAEDLDIAGSQLRTLANSAKITSPAGVLALPSNIGNHHINKLAQVPEADVKLSVPLMSCLTLSTGFSVLYWNRVLRPALQVDRAIDISQIPNFPPAAAAVPTGLNQPGVPFHQSDLLLFGFSIGLEFNW
jgi:hypothetical protein